MKATIKALLLALLLIIAYVQADSGSGKDGDGDDDDGDNSGDNDDDDGAYDRSLTRVSSGDRGVEFRSERRTDSSREEIRFRFSLGESGDNQLYVRLRYRMKNETANTEEQGIYSVTFVSLETTDTNGQRTGVSPFSTVLWKPFTVTPIGSNFDVSAESQDGSFKVVGHVVATVSSVDGVPVKPTSLKFDVIMQKSTTDYYKLNTRVFAVRQLKLDDESHEQKEGFSRQKEKQVTFGTDAGFFSWADYATINNQNITVQDSALSGPTDSSDDGFRGKRSDLSFTFATAQQGQLVWDPKVGLVVTTTSSAVTLFSGFMLIIFALLF